MIRFVLPFILFILFLVEGTWFQIFVPFSTNQEIVLVPRFLLIAVVLIAIFRGPLTGVIIGAASGLLYDFVYTDLLGIYMFSFGFTAYLSSFTYRTVRVSYIWQLIIILGAILIFEWVTYGLYYMIGYTDILFEEFFRTRLVPSWLLNGGAALLFLYPFRKLFEKLEEYEELQQR
ncbi:rod shape-determining protein MreD [Bacillus piscicola]|uniref:rod shape-determining protein MreD n=1 Tax=Bacillus piscicola TaxID=1632684 RepID=UPI001F098DF3|nr:rod shape-determining protein MreD [Bacillus piscicola]